MATCLALIVAGASAMLPARSFAQEANNESADTRLQFIEQLYQEGEGFRAESEILRFLFDFPDDPRRARVELAKAKLYYRDQKPRRAGLMLYSLLDRYRRDPVTPQAQRLLVFSLARQDQLSAAEERLPRAGLPSNAIDELRAPFPNLTSPDTAVAWSTWLPGTGFFALGQTSKGVAAVGLNLGFTAAAALTYQQGNAGAALVFLLVEIALYTGGRGAVRDAAMDQWRRAKQERLDLWLEKHGEPQLLGVGVSHTFGGR